MAGRYFCLGLPQRRHTVGGRAASRAAAARGCSLGADALADAGGGLLWLFWRNSAKKYSAEDRAGCVKGASGAALKI